jgi:hypothetical protein
MADDEQTQQTETPAPAPAPAFDADALATQVAERLKDQFQRSAPAPAPAPRPAPAADPVADLLAPYVQPAVQAARLDAQSATDAAEFYTSHGDLEKDDKVEIERRFQALKERGVPFKREDIYNHLLGERIDKEVDKRIEKRAKAVQRAADAGTTVGGGSPDKSGQALRDARDMSTADLGKALEGASF